MATKTAPAIVVCHRCRAEGKRPGKLPRGWKRHNAHVWCDRCWHANYVLRAISIPVVRPLGDGIGWSELRAAVNEAWAAATSLANWASTQCYAGDVQRDPGQEKMPKAVLPYLYPAARQRFPQIPSQAVVGQLHRVQRNYSASRYEVIWTCGASLRSYRYPQPAAVPNQAWTASYEPAGKDGGDPVPCVSVPLPGGRFLLQLRAGRDFARQLADFRQIVNGTAVQGELSLYRQRVGGNEHRSGGMARDSGNQRTHWRLMVKMVAWFPRKPAGELTGTLSVRTDADSFLVALDAKGEKLWVLNADHVRRWINEHTRRLNRWSEDQKAEQRPTASFQSRREHSVVKFRQRIDSFIKEAVAQLANFARRRRYAAVKLDDTLRTYLPKFDWSGFKGRLAVKMDEYGIRLELASDEVDSKAQETLAETEVEND